MKRLILIAAIILVANCSFGQSLKKGNLVGLHVMTVNLASGATMDQFQTFFIYHFSFISYHFRIAEHRSFNGESSKRTKSKESFLQMTSDKCQMIYDQ